MQTITLKIDDSINEKFFWLINHFSKSEIKILEQSEYMSDDDYLRKINGMAQSIKEARNEPIENGVTLDKLASGGLKSKALKLIEIIKFNPLQYPPEYEFLKDDVKGLVSRRINKQHRLVYEIFEDEKLIKVYRMWGHYE